MYCNESYIPDIPNPKETVSWLYDVIYIADMHFDSFENTSDDNNNSEAAIIAPEETFDNIILLKVKYTNTKLFNLIVGLNV